MAFDPNMPDATNGWLTPFMLRNRVMSMTTPGMAAAAPNGPVAPQAAPQAAPPSSQTLPTSLPFQTPGLSDPWSPFPSPPPLQAGQTDEGKATADRYSIPEFQSVKAPAGSSYQGPTDPGAFASLDFMGEPNGPNRPQVGATETSPADFASLDYMGTPYGPERPRGSAPTARQRSNPTGFAPRLDAASDPQRDPSGRLTDAQLDAQWARTVPGESGGRIDAVNPTSGASGLTQFMPKTLQGFLASNAGQGYTEEDYRKNPEVQRKAFNWLTQQNAQALAAATGREATPAELSAAHLLGAGGASALLQNPNLPAVAALSAKYGTNFARSALMTSNPAFKITADDTAAQAIAKIDAYYTGAAAKSGGGVATSSSPSATPVAAPTPAASQASTALPDQIEGMGPGALPAGYRPVTGSDKMLALAGGILRGKGLSDGLGQGIQDMQKLGIDDQNTRFKIMQEAANTALLRKRLDLVGAQTTAALAKPEQANRALNIREDQGNAGLDIRQQNADTAAAAARARADLQGQHLRIAQENAAALNGGGRALAAGTSKDSLLVTQGLSNDVASAGNDLQKIADLKELVRTQGVTGNSFRQEFTRFAADRLGLDIGVDQATNNLVAKNMADFNSSAVLGQAKGMISRLTQGEFNTLRAGVANMGTNPEALNAMLDSYAAAAKRRLDIGMDWNQLQRTNPAEASRIMSDSAGGGLRSWYTSKVGGDLIARGINSDPHQVTPSQYSRDSNGAWQHVETGSGSPPVRFRIN